MTTEYYDISIPVDASEDIKAAFVEIRDHLLSISERLNDIGRWHAYGGFQAAAVTIAIAAADTWEHVTNSTHDLWSGLEAEGMSLSGDIITIKKAGDYFGTLTMSVSGLANKDFRVRIFNITQNLQQGNYLGVSTTGAGNYADVTVPIYLEANAGDSFRMEVACTTDASDPTFNDAIFHLIYLHR